MGVHINKTVPFTFFIFPDFQLKLYGNWHLLNKPTLVFSSGIINYWNTLDSSIGKKGLKIQRWQGVNKNRRNCSASAWRLNEGRKLPDSGLQVQQKDPGEAEDWWSTALKDFRRWERGRWRKFCPKAFPEGCEDLSCMCTLSQSAEDPFSFVSGTWQTALSLGKMAEGMCSYLHECHRRGRKYMEGTHRRENRKNFRHL